DLGVFPYVAAGSRAVGQWRGAGVPIEPAVPGAADQCNALHRTEGQFGIETELLLQTLHPLCVDHGWLGHVGWIVAMNVGATKTRIAAVVIAVIALVVGADHEFADLAEGLERLAVA